MMDPVLYYQLMTLFVPHVDAAFPVFYALMSRKTGARYVKLFEMLKVLAPQFTPVSAMDDFEEAAVSAFQRVFLICRADTVLNIYN